MWQNEVSELGQGPIKLQYKLDRDSRDMQAERHSNLSLIFEGMLHNYKEIPRHLSTI